MMFCMNKKLYFTLGIALACGISNVFAQVPNEPYDGKEASKLPRIGLGYGIFTYFGDVRDNTFNHPFTSSSGGELTIERNINKYLNLYIKAVAGKISVNERTENRNLNFQSSLFLGSVNVLYNFNNFYKRPKVLQPFISLGVGVFSFDSKTDLKSASGSPYYYWSDGSIRDMSETGPGAEGAKFVSRDYTYETDLRQLNTEGRGKYSRLAFSVPIEFGALFRVSPRVSFKIGATYYYNFTNLIDNVTDQGTGNLQGTKGSDNFLFTSFGVNFNLENPNKRKKNPVLESIPDSLFADMDTKDTDGDGVPDFQDECAATPKGVLISKNGCPLDDDNDGIENFRDEEEKSTQPNPPVTVDGRNFTDAIIASSLPKDSIALMRDLIEKVFANQMRIYGFPVKDFKQSLIDSITRGGAVDQLMEAKIDSLFKAIDSQYNQRQKSDERFPEFSEKDGKNIKVVDVPIVSSDSKASAQPDETKPENGNSQQNTVAGNDIKQANLSSNDESETEMLTDQERNAIENIVNKEGEKKKGIEKNGNSEPSVATSTQNNNSLATEGKISSTSENISGTKKAENTINNQLTKTSEINNQKDAISSTKPLNGKNYVPAQYKNFDFNTDGVLTSDEVLKAIDLYTDGMLKMQADELFEMIDYYNSKMKNAKVIDYGVSKGIYIDGVLKIVKKEQAQESATPKRKLPASFKKVDLNADNEITAKEVDEIIKMHKAGNKAYSAEFVNELIDWFFED